jgi:small subunit ribosomal protein S8
MANHDPISDMLTRIRNASEKRHESTRIPASRMSRSIANVLQQEGFIAAISEEGEGVQRQLVLELKYSGKHRQPTIRRVQRVSKPGLRIYRDGRDRWGNPRTAQAGATGP